MVPSPRTLARAFVASALAVLSPAGCERPPKEEPPRSTDPDPTRGTTRSTPPPDRQETYRYQWSKSCAGCHPEQYALWEHSLHALAHAEPVYDHYFIKASQQSQKALEPYCGRCHTPLAVLSGAIPFGHPLQKAGDTRVDRVAREGVQCDFCHTTRGHTQVSNAGYVLEPSDVKRGPLSRSKPVSHRAAQDPRFRSAEYCGTCHQVIHPTNGIHLETTYAEWKTSPFAKAGVVCQDCHMTDGLEPGKGAEPIGRPVRHPGKAAAMGESRPHVSRHFFVGPNVLFLDRAGQEAAGERARREAFLRRAGRVEILGISRAKDGLYLSLRVKNTGAGHSLPTGITEVRELWLEVVVKNPGGKVLLHSGALDAQGNLTPGTLHYRTIVHDAQGRDTTLFWNTVKKIRDRRIPSLGSLDERIPLPQGLRGQVTVEAALRYRSISPAGLAEAGVPAGTVTVPVLTVHQVSTALTL